MPDRLVAAAGGGGGAGPVLAGGAVAIAVVALAARWIAGHPEQVRRLARRQLDRRPVAGLTRRYRSQLSFLADRFGPGSALGLALTVQLAVLVAAGWAFGSLLHDVLGGGGAVRIDRPVVRYLAEHRTVWLTATMRTITWMGSVAVLIPLVVVVGLEARRRARSWAAMAQLGLVLAGSVAMYDLIKAAVGRTRPDIGQLVATATGYSFPSGHATQTAAVAVTLALLASAVTGSWPAKVAAWSVAALAAGLAGFSRVYLGVHWPTDVLAGYALGTVWAALAHLAIGLRGRSSPATADSTAPAGNAHADG